MITFDSKARRCEALSHTSNIGLAKASRFFEDFVNVLFANRIAAQFDVYDVKQLILIREAQLYREDATHEDSDTGRQIGITDDDSRQPGIDA